MYWRNSNFQILYFLVGKCHTPDEAYRQLLQLHEERDTAVKAQEAYVCQHEAKRLRALRILRNPLRSKAAKLDAQAVLIEQQILAQQQKNCLDQAVRERTFIEELIARIEPLRKFAHLPDYEAHQQTQREEWYLELVKRAENCLLGQGYIPHDQLAAMRAHPDWEKIHASICELQEAMKSSSFMPKPSSIAPTLLEALHDRDRTER